jgi:hypothetical protein
VANFLIFFPPLRIPQSAILFRSSFNLLPLSAIFRAFMQPPTKLNADAAPAKQISADAQAGAAVSGARDDVECS